MYLSFAVYLICLLIFLWGISIKKRGQFHEDYLANGVMKSMRGLAAIGVILHHISQEEVFKDANELSIFVNAGYMFVSLFFFCSGYGLLKKLDTEEHYMDGFLKKRLPIVIVPYYTSIVLYGIFNLITGNHLEPVQWITNIIGVTMMNEYAWYPIILAILYVLFYLLFRKEGSRCRKLLVMLFAIIAMGMIFCAGGHFLWWAGSSPNWWMNPYSSDGKHWWITNIIGVTMMNEYAWYPIILAILYVLFYLLFRKEGSRRRKLLVMLFAIIAMGMIFCAGGHFLWWAGSSPNWWMNPYSSDGKHWWMQQKVFWLSGEWWVNSQIAFLLGMVYETNEEKITAFFRRKYPLKLFLLILATLAAHVLSGFTQGAFGYWSEFAGKGPGIGDKIICYFTQLPHVILFTLYIIVFTMKIRTINPVTRFFGKYSLDTYMMNLMAILIFRPLFLDFPGRIIKDPHIGRPLFAVCVFAATIVLALIAGRINSFIKAKITT